MIASNVARRYAKAVLALGIEAGNLDALVEEIGSIAEVYSSSAELQGALSNPVVAIDAKRAILADLGARLGLGTTANNTLRFLLERRRLTMLPSIARAVREIFDARRGIVRAEVWTAVPLDDTYFERLRLKLETMTGQRVTLERNHDPSILGGVITRIGDTIVDGSLRARLQEMKQSLEKAASPS